MRIDFVETRENGYLAYYSISQDVVYKGKLHDEILWNEMRVMDDGTIKITWEDDWQHPEILSDLVAAKVHVTKNYFRHNGYENGRTYELS